MSRASASSKTVNAGVEPRADRVGAQDPCAEAVEGGDPGGIEVACAVAAAQLDEAPADARAQLPRGLVGERDREDPARLDVVF